MRRFVLFGVLCFSLVFAQSDLEQMQTSIDDGYYAVAAQLLGPEIISQEEYQNDPEAYYLYALALYFDSSINDARLALDTSFSLSSEPPARYKHLDGLLYAAEGNVSKATEVLQATFQESKLYDVAMDWGLNAWQAGRNEEALEAFSQAANTKQGQRELWPHLSKGRILKALNDYPKAIEAFIQAIDVFDANDSLVGNLPSPGYVEAFYQLGLIYELQGNLEEARINFESARDVGSNYPPAVAALERLNNQ